MVASSDGDDATYKATYYLVLSRERGGDPAVSPDLSNSCPGSPRTRKPAQAMSHAAVTCLR